MKRSALHVVLRLARLGEQRALRELGRLRRAHSDFSAQRVALDDQLATAGSGGWLIHHPRATRESLVAAESHARGLASHAAAARRDEVRAADAAERARRAFVETRSRTRALADVVAKREAKLARERALREERLSDELARSASERSDELARSASERSDELARSAGERSDELARSGEGGTPR
jgi:hypothetical protein